MRDREAGLAERLNRRTVARPPSSCEGKWTFFCWGGEGGGEGDRRGVLDPVLEPGGDEGTPVCGSEMADRWGVEGAERARWWCVGWGW